MHKNISTGLNILITLVLALSFLCFAAKTHGMAADCQLAPAGENYIGVRYKALLVENELSETGWLLLFGGSGFTVNGEYQPHFIDLMIKGSWAAIHEDALCANGFPPVQQTWDNFTLEFGLSDYEDWSGQDNDIGAWTNDPELLPRRYTNIDSHDPRAADKIMVEYQVNKGGTLEGREIEVSFVRAEQTRLSHDVNYFMDPDLQGTDLCNPNSQDDILYRRWIATLKVPSLGINSFVDFYIYASQADKITGNNTLNFMWENPGRAAIESDRYKVIIFDPEVKKTTGEWVKATKFLVDLRTPDNELPLDEDGTLVGGYRKVMYYGQPALEASFGYGYTDYVIDGNPNNYETSTETKALIDLAEDVIPVELSRFDIEPVENSVLLKWTTLSETNNYGFEIERCIDNWEKIGFVQGQVTTAGKHDYQFIDKLQNEYSSIIHYRLKQIDMDGSFTYSKSKSVDLSHFQNFQLYQNYPNPFNPATMINYQLTKTCHISLKIYDILGKEIVTLVDGRQNAGQKLVKWSGTDKYGKIVRSGMYIYSLKVGTKRINRKMLLIR